VEGLASNGHPHSDLAASLRAQQPLAAGGPQGFPQGSPDLDYAEARYFAGLVALTNEW
jgi:hypothetical protein